MKLSPAVRDQIAVTGDVSRSSVDRWSRDPQSVHERTRRRCERAASQLGCLGGRHDVATHVEENAA